MQPTTTPLFEFRLATAGASVLTFCKKMNPLYDGKPLLRLMPMKASIKGCLAAMRRMPFLA